jgi:hypothetical protein
MAMLNARGNSRQNEVMSTEHAISPEVFFDTLRQCGIRVDVTKDTVSAKDVVGTVRRRRLFSYLASKNSKGNILSLQGEVHAVGEEVLISATITMTSTLRLAVGEVDSLKLKKVEKENLLDIMEWADKCDELSDCRDYTLGTG